MGARAKPNSSYAPNRLTRNNGPKSSLLSTFRDKQPEVKPAAMTVAPKAQKRDTDTAPTDPVGSSSPLSSATDLELSDVPSEVPDMEAILPSTELETRLGPGTDDEPLSSEEEQSDSDASPPRKEANYMTLDQKLAEAKAAQSSSRKTKLGRTASDMIGDSDEDEFFSSWGSSQSKRAKFNTYQTKGSYFNRPAFARPAESPESKAKQSPKSKQTPKARQTSKAKETPKAKQSSKAKKAPSVEEKAAEELKEPEVSFIVPKDILSPTLAPQEKGIDLTVTPRKANDVGNDSGADSPLSSTSSSFFRAIEVEKEPSPPLKALCPMCKVEVDPEILAEFKAQPKQRIREQQQFCEAHKARSAAQQWKQRKYPTIAWDQLKTRVQNLFPDIEKLLVPDAFSYYRNTLDEILASGKARNFRLTIDGKTLEVITCGYYGTKGASMMLHAVIARFSRSLRRLATTDRIIKTAGVAAYAQCVLVPELAMRLVKQDMDVDDEGARQIMRESMDIGQKMNPEANDIVPVPADSEGIAAQDSEDSDEEDEDEDEEDLGDEEDMDDMENNEEDGKFAEVAMDEGNESQNLEKQEKQSKDQEIKK